MKVFTPNLSILPESQQQVWSRLGATPDHFVLYGGTAVALRFGHRESIDFDFFSSQNFQPSELAQSIAYLKDQAITQQSDNTLSCNIETDAGKVKISFFGGLSLGQIAQPDRVARNGISVASTIDLLGMKCATVPQRNEVKDYLDIHALLTFGMLDLAQGIAAAKAIYGRQYDPLLTLQALCYFDDLREPLPETLKTDLIAAVKSVSLSNLPTMVASRKIGMPGPPS